MSGLERPRNSEEAWYASEVVTVTWKGLLHSYLGIFLPIKTVNMNQYLLTFEQSKEFSSSDENEEMNLCKGLLTLYPTGYDPLQFSENESGKLQVLVKLLAAIHELRPTEK